MKKILSLLVIILSAAAAFGVNDAMTAKALTPLAGDLKKKLTGVKTLSVYAVLKDKEKRYSDTALRKAMERIMRSAGYSIASRDEGMTAAQSEIELSATGVIDIASVKQAGKMAGVDVFFFVYPSVGGIFGERVTITIKGVNVATGAVQFSEEYYYEERPLIGVEVAMMFPVYSWYRAVGTLSAEPVSPATFTAWSLVLTPSKQQYVTPHSVFVSLNIPSAALSVRLGVGMLNNFDLGANIITDHAFASNNTTNAAFPTQTMKATFTSMLDATFPISLLFGDYQDVLRGYIGGQLILFDNNMTEANHVLASVGAFNGSVGYIVSTKLPLFTWAVRTGLELKIAYGFCLTAGCTIALPWTFASDAPKNGVSIVFNSPLAAEINAGVVFRLF